MYRYIYFLVFLAYLQQSQSLEHSPVFITDNGILRESISFPVNPFKSISAEDFSKITDHVQSRSETVLFFIEEHFCVEDVSAKDEIGTSYPFLRQSFLDKSTVYFPKVTDPYATIRHMFQIFDFNTFHLRSTTSKLRIDENYKFYYIFFIDGNNETRVEALRRHDAMMKSIMFSAQQLAKGPVTAFYTGKRNPVRRSETEPLSLPSLAKESAVWNSVDCGNATFEFYDAKLTNNDAEGRLIPTGCRYVHGKDYFGYDVFFDSHANMDRVKTYRLKFMFMPLDPAAKGWKWTEVAWTTDNYGTLYSHAVNVSGPWDQWYASSAPLLITPSEWYEPKCVIASFKLNIHTKPYSKTSKPVSPTTAATTSKQTFPVEWSTHLPYTGLPENLRDRPQEVDTPPVYTGDNDDLDATRNTRKGYKKELFFTIPILSGLVVVGVMLGILQWGVYMLFSCVSNDRLDSPDSKPLMTAYEE